LFAGESLPLLQTVRKVFTVLRLRVDEEGVEASRQGYEPVDQDGRHRIVSVNFNDERGNDCAEAGETAATRDRGVPDNGWKELAGPDVGALETESDPDFANHDQGDCHPFLFKVSRGDEAREEEAGRGGEEGAGHHVLPAKPVQ